jgi:phosphoglycerate dehydrogenase-like enzyme
MAKPKIYVHRIGSWARRYLDDQNLARLAEFAEVVDDSPLEHAPDDIVASLKGVDGILSLNGSGAEDITAEALKSVGTVRVAAVSHWFHGSHDRAAKAWRSAGVNVIDASWGNNFAVAQWTLGAMLTGVFRFAELDRSLRAGELWPECQLTSSLLDGQRVGIVGLGRIGRLVAGLLKPFTVELVGYDKYVTPEQAAEFGVKWLALDDVMATADIVTFHLPVTDETTRLITRKQIESIRQGALVINSARTAILDYQAFCEALKRGQIRAIVDVFEPEPPPVDDVLRSLPNIVMTPHIAGATARMCHVCGRTAIAELRKLLT